MTDSKDRAWMEVNLGALRRNGELLVRHSGARLLPMVKADAYGLGVGPVVRTLEHLDPWGYGVATVAEGEELRSLGISRPLVVFTPLLAEDLAAAREAELTPTLASAETIEAWAKHRAPWHLAIDTGMQRAGLPWREVASVVEVVRRFPPQAVFTHFHSAETDPASMSEQERRFEDALQLLPKIALVHTDNSAAIIRRGHTKRPIVRPGIFLYGGGGFAGSQLSPEQVVHVRARIVEIRDAAAGDTVSYGATFTASRPSRIATLGIGHADGYPIAMSDRGMALVRGATAPVVGRVTMDMTMLDVTGVECETGDVATLIGSDGPTNLSLDDVATRGVVSPYELLVRMRNRIPRMYGDG